MANPIVYFAGPLFTSAEREWNANMARGLRQRGFDVLLPQEDAAAVVAAAPPGQFDPRKLFDLAVTSVARATVVLAIMDGADVDSGTAFECGVAWKSGKPIVGLRTDLRESGDDPAAGVNLMLSGACQIERVAALHDPAQDVYLDQIAKALRKAIRT